MGKKQWQKPELIIITRSTPEENVLVSCKGNGSDTSFSSMNNGCGRMNPPCSTCDSIALS